jgi:hypothetical protein
MQKKLIITILNLMQVKTLYKAPINAEASSPLKYRMVQMVIQLTHSKVKTIKYIYLTAN